MTETANPFDGGPYLTHIEFSNILSASTASGVIPSPLNSCEVFSDNDGKQVKVRVGAAVIRATSYINDAIKTISIDANTGAARVDMIVLKLNVPLKSITAVLKPGTSGSTSPPVLTQVAGGVWEIPLAVIAVGSGFTSIITGNITDVRHFSGPNIPAGELGWTGGSVADPGYLYANGAAVYRNAYPALFAKYGTTWGAGNGSTTFNLPNVAGKIPIGLGANGISLATTGGATTHTNTLAEMYPHAHGVDDNGHKHNMDADPGNRYVVSAPGAQANSLAGAATPGVTFSDIDLATTGIQIQATGGGTAYSIMPPHVGMLPQIKAH